MVTPYVISKEHKSTLQYVDLSLVRVSQPSHHNYIFHSGWVVEVSMRSLLPVVLVKLDH